MADLTPVFPGGFVARPPTFFEGAVQMNEATRTANEAAIHYGAAGMKLCAIPSGSKGPKYPNWPNLPIFPDQISGRGIGLLHVLSGTCVLDFDDLHESHIWLAARGIDLVALFNADDAVHVVSGRINRGKLLYRLPEGVTHLPTRKHKTPAGATMIEFRCASEAGSSVQDVLPPTVHPEIGQPYRWGGNGDFSQLPELPEDLFALWNSFVEAASADSLGPSGGIIPRNTASVFVDKDVIKDLRSALMFMRADDYELWIRMGLALYELGDVGRGLWMEWSSQSEKFNAKAAARKWESFK